MKYSITKEAHYADGEEYRPNWDPELEADLAKLGNMSSAE